MLTQTWSFVPSVKILLEEWTFLLDKSADGVSDDTDFIKTDEM